MPEDYLDGSESHFSRMDFSNTDTEFNYPAVDEYAIGCDINHGNTEIDRIADSFGNELCLALKNTESLLKERGMLWKIGYFKFQKPCIEAIASAGKDPQTNRTLLEKKDFSTIEKNAGIYQALKNARKHFKSFLDYISQEDINIERKALENFLLRNFYEELKKQKFLSRLVLEKIIKRAVCIP